MNVFEIQAPDGTVYEVEADSLEQAAQAVSGLGGERPWHEVLAQNFLPDDDPNSHNAGETMAAALNKAGEAMTFGLIGDEADARVKSLLPGGGSYDEELARNRQQEEVLERDSPVLSLGAEIAGGAALPVGVLGGAARAGRSLGAAALQSGATTGLLSGLYGFMEGEGGAGKRATGAAKDMALGTALGAAVPVVGAGVQRAANSRAANRAIRRAARNAPSTSQLEGMAQDAYRAVDDLGVEIKAKAFDDARQRIVEALRAKTAYSTRPGARTLVPKASAVVDDMALASDEMAEQSASALPFREIDGFRRQAGAAAGNFKEPSDQKAGMTIIEGLNDLVSNLSLDDVEAGDAKALPGLIEKARSLYSQMSKSQSIDDAMSMAENYRYGFSNGIKWQFKKILNNPKLSRGFSDGERRVMQRVINGTIPERAMEFLGSGLTSIGGIAGAGLGMAGGGLPAAAAGLALTGTSMAARGVANVTARKNAEIARALIASGGASNLALEAPQSVRRIAEQLLRQGTAVAAE